MASWLKRAEDLFEVVDRRAKLVASELAEDQPDVPVLASNGKGSQRRKSKAKVKKRDSKESQMQKGDIKQEESSSQPILSDSKPDDLHASPSENNGPIPETPTVQTNRQLLGENENNTSSSFSGTSTNDLRDMDAGQVDAGQVDAAVIDDNVVNTSSNGEPGIENTSAFPDAVPSAVPAEKGNDLNFNSHPSDPDSNFSPKDSVNPLEPEEEKPQSEIEQTSRSDPTVATDEKKVNSLEATPESISGSTGQEDGKANTKLNKVEEQLDEARGLLKSTSSTGQSKEARLAKVCAGLSSRLQEYKSENAQLEELLSAERELSKSYEYRIKQLEQDLSSTKREVSRAESHMAEALAAKNSEIETLVSSLDALKKQAAASEGNVASLQANMETLMRNRELTETRMMQALREELSLAERRAEEEHAAHNATKKAAMEREVELEHRAVDASTALARIQRLADERAAKAGELEQKVALLEVECANLNQELRDIEGRLRREQKKSPEDANQSIQIQAWQQEVERARLAQNNAEGKVSSLEAELQKMRVEMAAMKRDAEHYSRQEHMELEKRYRELTDLLYYKQTQLESMASEKAAAEFQLDKEIKRLQEVQAEAERSRIARRASSTWDEETDMKELEPLPLHQRHLAGASIQLRKAAKLLDSGALGATKILWRHPRARVALFFYLVFVHLFLMFLLHRLQAQADDFSAQEVAQSMGLAQPNLPRL